MGRQDDIIQQIATALQNKPVTPVAVPNFFPGTPFGKAQQAQDSSGSPSLPTGLLDKFMPGGGGSGLTNTAGSAVTDSGSWGATGGAADGIGGADGFAGLNTAFDGSAAAGGSSAAGGGSGAAGLGGLGSLGPAAGFAALIGVGANTEANHANTPVGDGLLATMGPSLAQLIKDPKGMGIPTALGVPFLTPFTASSDAKATKPEFSGLFGLGF